MTMVLSNILITDPNAGPITSLPDVIAENVAAARALHPSLDYRLFQEPDILEFIEKHYDKEVRNAYLGLRPYAYRADLARYCIIYELGGLHVDLSWYMAKPIPLEDRPVVFRGNLISAPWDADNAIFYAPPRHKAIECALRMACANVKRNYYGSTSLCPTGPAMFGKALATSCEAEELTFGGARFLTPRSANAALPKLVLPNDDMVHVMQMRGALVALKRKPMLSGGLTGLGVPGNNDYRELWNERRVYV